MNSLPLVGRALSRALPLALTLIALAGSARTAAGQTFAAPLLPAQAPAKDIVTLDLDAGGVPDIAVLDGDVTLLRAQPDGSYVVTDVIATSGAGKNMRVADMDLDGDDDLVISGYSHLEVLRLQNGVGLFMWDYPSGGRSVDVGDLDGDGATDVVVADFNLAQITVRLGLSFAGLGPPTTYATGANPYEIALADLDQDGALDVITSDLGGSSLTVRLGDGAGGFGPALTHALAGSPSLMVLTDTNGDGLLDVVVDTPSGLTVLAGDGAGGFSETLTLTVPAFVSDLEAHDVDGDGDEDLVLSVGADDGLVVFLATGDGGFEPFIPSFPGYYLTALAVDDLDLDGRAEILGGIDGPHILMARGDGAGSFVQPGALSFPTDADLVSLADLNADGLSDLVSATAAAAVTEVRLGLGGGDFAAPVASPVDAIDVARFGDFDRDGLNDLVTLATGGITVRRSDGAGGLLPGVVTPLSPDPVMDAAVADMNGDGDQDVVILTFSSNQSGKRYLGTLLGDGAGGLAPPNGYFLYDVDYPHPDDRLKLGDVDGDGRPDAVVHESYPGQLRVLLGDGSGWFIAGAVLSDTMLPNAGEDPLALADLDGDGALDIVARRNNSSQIRAWSGHGDGTFAVPVTLTTTASAGLSVAVGDVDQDGFADIVFDTYSRFGVLLGSAGGSFEPADYARPAGFPAGRIFLGSLDGDAFPDVVGVETDGAQWPTEPKFTSVSTHRNLATSAQWADLGYGLAGTNGVPSLVGAGTLEAGSAGTLKLSNANPNKLAILFISKQSNPTPFKGGVLATVPPLISFMFVTSPAGAINLSWPHWPGGAIGSHWYFQYGVVDAGGPFGAALSNALRATQP